MIVDYIDKTITHKGIQFYVGPKSEIKKYYDTDIYDLIPEMLKNTDIGRNLGPDKIYVNGEIASTITNMLSQVVKDINIGITFLLFCKFIFDHYNSIHEHLSIFYILLDTLGDKLSNEDFLFVLTRMKDTVK